jgi:hypothetical protein
MALASSSQASDSDSRDIGIFQGVKEALNQLTMRQFQSGVSACSLSAPTARADELGGDLRDNRVAVTMT